VVEHAASSNWATCRLSAGCSPPRIPSVMFSLAVTAIREPVSARAALTICRASLARFSVPPAAIRRWNSIRLFDTVLRGLMPSKVTAFSTRLRTR